MSTTIITVTRTVALTFTRSVNAGPIRPDTLDRQHRSDEQKSKHEPEQPQQKNKETQAQAKEDEEHSGAQGEIRRQESAQHRCPKADQKKSDERGHKGDTKRQQYHQYERPRGGSDARKCVAYRSSG